MDDFDFQMPDMEIARRELQIFFLCDCSGSMSGERITALNRAIPDALDEVKYTMLAYPEVSVSVRVISFNSNASWHIGPDASPLEQVFWTDLRASGTTATHEAIRLLASELDLNKMPRRGLPPVCVLVSDGHANDGRDYERAIAELIALPWGKKAVRLSIGVGQRQGYDEAELAKFISHPEIGVLHASNAESLVQYIKWASVTASVSASQGKSQSGNTAHQHPVYIPPPPPENIASSMDVF